MTEAILDALRAELARPMRTVPTPEGLSKLRAIAATPPVAAHSMN